MSTQSHIDKVNLQPMIIPYPTHVGSPKIEPQNLTFFKKNAVTKADKIIKKRIEELMKQAEDLQNSIILQKVIYESNYKFEPIVGEIYHLYEELNGDNSLSLIKPTEWNKKYLYSVILNSDMTWSKVG